MVIVLLSASSVAADRRSSATGLTLRAAPHSAAANARTLLVPDKDADGLSAGCILHHTLTLLGLDPALITTHLLTKGETVHTPTTSALLAAHRPRYIFVLDQGSRAGPPLIPDHAACTTLVIDHHHATPADFPAHSSHVTACASPPVATSALLTYTLCTPLHAAVPDRCAWLCAVGTHGDLGTTLKWAPPFPDMAAAFTRHTKKGINDAVALLNAPRRTAAYDVRSAWDALLAAAAPSPDVTRHPRLLAARAEVAAEVERCAHAAPRFSADGRVAVLRIRSPCQVHPVIATRWANHLSSPKLEIVMVANEAYLPGKVNFSCRVARVARARASAGAGADVDIIASLRALVARDDTGTLAQRLGDDFARGHVQASGGIVGVHEFEELMALLRVGEKPDAATPGPRGKARKADEPGQRNTLMSYFGKGAASAGG